MHRGPFAPHSTAMPWSGLGQSGTPHLSHMQPSCLVGSNSKALHSPHLLGLLTRLSTMKWLNKHALHFEAREQRRCSTLKWFGPTWPNSMLLLYQMHCTCSEAYNCRRTLVWPRRNRNHECTWNQHTCAHVLPSCCGRRIPSLAGQSAQLGFLS